MTTIPMAVFEVLAANARVFGEGGVAFFWDEALHDELADTVVEEAMVGVRTRFVSFVAHSAKDSPFFFRFRHTATKARKRSKSTKANTARCSPERWTVGVSKGGWRALKLSIQKKAKGFGRGFYLFH